MRTSFSYWYSGPSGSLTCGVTLSRLTGCQIITLGPFCVIEWYLGAMVLDFRVHRLGTGGRTFHNKPLPFLGSFRGRPVHKSLLQPFDISSLLAWAPNIYQSCAKLWCTEPANGPESGPFRAIGLYGLLNLVWDFGR